MHTTALTPHPVCDGILHPVQNGVTVQDWTSYSIESDDQFFFFSIPFRCMWYRTICSTLSVILSPHSISFPPVASFRE